MGRIGRRKVPATTGLESHRAQNTIPGTIGP